MSIPIPLECVETIFVRGMVFIMLFILYYCEDQACNKSLYPKVVKTSSLSYADISHSSGRYAPISRLLEICSYGLFSILLL